MTELAWRIGEPAEANRLLADHHYLGPLKTGGRPVIVGELDDGRVVAAMVWKLPTSRRLPGDGSWLELARWCLTPDAGANAGSRMHAAAVRVIRAKLPIVTTLVSYSDPGHGHTGALYRACNWRWCPTWQRLRPPPSGQGNWGSGPQRIKDRWIFPVRDDPARAAALLIDDFAAIRFWQARATPDELRWASTSLNLRRIP